MIATLKVPLEKWLVAVRVLSSGGPDASARALALLMDVASDRNARKSRAAVESAVRAARMRAGDGTAAAAAGSQRGSSQGAGARPWRSSPLGASRVGAGSTVSKTTASSSRGPRSGDAAKLSIDEWYAPHRS